MATFATAENVLNAWIGADAPLDTAKVDYWIGRAERLLLREIPDLQERINSEQVSGEDVVDVVVDMVTRVFRNPANTRSTQKSRTTGQITESETTTAAGDTPGGLFLDPAEKERLLDAGDDSDEQSAFSVFPGGRR